MLHIPVLIAGGGPAGVATGLSLRSRGVPCMIAEGAPAAKMKPGESLPPQTVSLLERLGMSSLLNSPAHIPCYGNRFIWGQDTPVDKLFLFHTHTQGWHLDRGVFEEQLQEMAGQDYYYNTYVSKCTRSENRWMVELRRANGNNDTVTCDFIVDATGRACRIARQLSITRRNIDKLAGVSACFELQEKVAQYTFIEAVENGWWYAAPLSFNRLAVCYMSDSDLLPTIGLPDVSQTTIIRTLLNDVSTATTVHAANTGYLEKRFGPGWLAVGDAAYAYDPISSYGITSALESGYYAGHAIADTLAGNKDAMVAYDWVVSKAFEVYMEGYVEQYKGEGRWSGREFWRRRVNV